MTLVYQSTRDENNRVTASQAILQGLAADGGLFTPLTTLRWHLTLIDSKVLLTRKWPSWFSQPFLDDLQKRNSTTALTMLMMLNLIRQPLLLW